MISTNDQNKILLIEDDPDIAELVEYNLRREGYQVVMSADGQEGLDLAKRQTPRLIVLDLMLPGLDGLSICQQLRNNSSTARVPIIMLTAKSEESDVVVGLEIGADDYLIKPFSPRELVARVKAILRRQRNQIDDPNGSKESAAPLQVGPIAIDSERHEVFHRSNPLTLTLAEYRLLSTLISRPGRVFTREQLLEKITGGEAYVIDRNVDVHIRAIRKKLGDDAGFIITVRGIGYKCRE